MWSRNPAALACMISLPRSSLCHWLDSGSSGTLYSWAGLGKEALWLARNRKWKSETMYGTKPIHSNIVLDHHAFCYLVVYQPVVVKVHRSSTWVKVQIRIIKYYSSKSKSTAFSILLEWKYKSTQFFMYLSKKVLIDRFILQFYIDYFI